MIQFTCASATIATSSNASSHAVWICSSDGYVGQMGVLNLEPEPEIQCCNGVTNSRITCICAVAPPK